MQQEEVSSTSRVPPTYSLDDISTSSLPTTIPEEIRDEIILDARGMVEGNLTRKAFNSTTDYEVPRDHTSRPLTLTVNKKG